MPIPIWITTAYSTIYPPGGALKPCTYEMDVDGFRMIVTRHIDHGPDAWVITCPIFKHVLTGISAEAAKAKALEMVCTSLKRLMGGFHG